MVLWPGYFEIKSGPSGRIIQTPHKLGITFTLTQSLVCLEAMVVLMLRSVVGVGAVSGPRDHRVEPIVLVGRVLHGADAAVGLHQTVLALHHVAVPGLVGALDVPRVLVVDPVLVAVLGVCLQQCRVLNFEP